MVNLVFLLHRTIDIMVEIIVLAITIDVILSWVYTGNSIFVRIIHAITEPVLKPFRSLINNSAIGGPGLRLDFSPVLAVLALSVIKEILIKLLYSLLL